MEPSILIAIVLLLLWVTGVIAWTVLTFVQRRVPRHDLPAPVNGSEPTEPRDECFRHEHGKAVHSRS